MPRTQMSRHPTAHFKEAATVLTLLEHPVKLKLPIPQLILHSAVNSTWLCPPCYLNPLSLPDLLKFFKMHRSHMTLHLCAFRMENITEFTFGQLSEIKEVKRRDSMWSIFICSPGTQITTIIFFYNSSLRDQDNSYNITLTPYLAH